MSAVETYKPDEPFVPLQLTYRATTSRRLDVYYINMAYIYDPDAKWPVLKSLFNFDSCNLQFDCPTDNLSTFNITPRFPLLLRYNLDTDALTKNPVGMHNTSNTGVLDKLRHEFHKIGMPGYINYFAYHDGDASVVDGEEKYKDQTLRWQAQQDTTTTMATMGINANLGDDSKTTWEDFVSKAKDLSPRIHKTYDDNVYQDSVGITPYYGTSETYSTGPINIVFKEPSQLGIGSVYKGPFTYVGDYVAMWDHFSKHNPDRNSMFAKAGTVYPGSIGLKFTINIRAGGGASIPHVAPIKDIAKIYNGEVEANGKTAIWACKSANDASDTEALQNIANVLNDLATDRFHIPIDFTKFPDIQDDDNINQFSVDFEIDLIVAGGLATVKYASQPITFNPAVSSNGNFFNESLNTSVRWDRTIATSNTYICPNDISKNNACIEYHGNDYICTDKTNCKQSDSDHCSINFGYAFGNCLSRLPDSSLFSTAAEYSDVPIWYNQERAVHGALTNACNRINNQIKALQQDTNLWTNLSASQRSVLESSRDTLINDINTVNKYHATTTSIDVHSSLYELVKDDKLCTIKNDATVIDTISLNYQAVWDSIQKIAIDVEDIVSTQNSASFDGSVSADLIRSAITPLADQMAGFFSAAADATSGLFSTRGTGKHPLPSFDPTGVNTAKKARSKGSVPSWAIAVIVVVIVCILGGLGLWLYFHFRNRK
jgi:hypothetical protein